MKIKRVEHIAIAVNSLKQSMDLLQNTFGIPLEYEEQIGATRWPCCPWDRRISNSWKARHLTPA